MLKIECIHSSSVTTRKTNHTNNSRFVEIRGVNKMNRRRAENSKSFRENFNSPRPKKNASLNELRIPEHSRQVLQELITLLEQENIPARTQRIQNVKRRVTVLCTGNDRSLRSETAHALANELKLEIFCIDLSGIVNKYIGETEKNLRKVFETAEKSNAVLFFDEADDLLGSRSEVKDAHDRYSNVDINYLFQRIQEYQGLIVLATNSKDKIKSNYLRHIDLLIELDESDE